MPSNSSTPPPKKTKAQLKLIENRKHQARDDFLPIPVEGPEVVLVEPVILPDGTVSFADTARKKLAQADKAAYRLKIKRRWLRLSDAEYARDLRFRMERMVTFHMNKQFAIIEYGDDVLVYSTYVDHKGNTKERFRSIDKVTPLFYSRQVGLPRVTPGGKVAQSLEYKTVFEIWNRNPARRELKGIVNAPGRELGPEYINQWKGWGCDPLRNADGTINHSGEECRLILKHLLEVICCNDHGLFKYVMAFLADIVQNPEDKKGTSLTLYGKQGIGKSIIALLLEIILGKGGFSRQNNAKFIRGEAGYTDGAGALCVVAEEAFFSGDPTLLGPLKTFISEPTMQVRHLFKDALTIDNYARLIALMNDEATGGHTNSIESDDRRNTILEVSPHRKGDRAYFNALIGEIRTGGAEAFFGVLLDPKWLEGVDLRISYDTDTKLLQKVYSLQPQAAYIYAMLKYGTTQINSRDPRPWSETGEVVICKEFYESYLAWGKTNKPGVRLGTDNALTRIINQVLAEPKKTKTSINGKQFHVWKLGALSTCRLAFEAWIGCKPEWRAMLWDIDGNGERQDDEEIEEDLVVTSLNPADIEDDQIPY